MAFDVNLLSGQLIIFRSSPYPPTMTIYFTFNFKFIFKIKINKYCLIDVLGLISTSQMAVEKMNQLQSFFLGNIPTEQNIIVKNDLTAKDDDIIL